MESITPSSTTHIPSATISSTGTPSCTTAVPGKYGSVPPGACNSYYFYDPNFGANIAFAALFGVTTLIHIVEAWAYKKVCVPSREPREEELLTLVHRGSVG